MELQEKMYSVEDRTKIGMALYYDIEEGRNQFAREIAAGHGDGEIRMAIYWALNDEKHIDFTDGDAATALLFAPGITLTLDDLKTRARAALVGKLFETLSTAQISGMADAFFRAGETNELTFQRRDRLQREAKQREAQTRSKFNAQHKPAPEGTVKELALKYGKSLSEIRRLKAAGELHSLLVCSLPLRNA